MEGFAEVEENKVTILCNGAEEGSSIDLKTAQDVGYPVLLDVVSNMGFIALLFSILIPLNHMGGLMVFAMISTSFGTLTVLASLIQILKVKKV